MTSRVPAQYIEPSGLQGGAVIREPSPPPHSAPGAAYIGVVEFFRILRRRGKLVIGTIAAIMLLTFFALTQMTPIYSTSAVLMIEPSKDPVAAAGTAIAAKPDEELRIATKMELLQSRTLARKVGRSMRLAEDPEFAPQQPEEPGLVARVLDWLSPAIPEDSSYAAKMSADDINEAAEQARMEAVTDKLMSQMSVERVAKSHLISVTASSTDPFKASLMANRLVESHIKGQMAEQQEEHKTAIEELAKRVDMLREKLKGSDTAVTAYRRTHDLFTARTEEMNSAMFARLSGALSEARATGAQGAARASAMLGMTSGLASSPVLNDLRTQEATLSKRVAELSSFYGKGHPDMVTAKAQLDEIRARVGDETQRAQSAAIATAAREARISRSAGAGVGTLAADLGALRAANDRQLAATVGLRDLERDAETSNALYMSLLAQLKDISGKRTGEKPDARIVSRAPIPDSPAHPEPKRMLAIALIGGIMLAVILAFVAENLDNRVRTADQIDRLLGLPTLAMIPDVSDYAASGPAATLISTQPRSTFSEAVRNLYIELLDKLDQPGSKVVVITSPLANEGKSTIATSLAAAASTLGHSAVVLDVDLRQPALAHALLGTGDEPDVIAYLTDRAGLDDLLEADDRSAQFAQIGAHELASDPGALISSPRLEKLIAQLRERFELVVLNAPPILPVRDAKILAGYADGALLVLRWGRTHPDAARVAVEIFGDKLVGAVVNRVDYREHARRNYGDAIHYYTQYATYYGDGSDPEMGGGRPPLWRIFDKAMGRNGARSTAEA